jgi:hypothetical protein
LFGYGPKLTQEKLRVAEALEGLPVMARALESGAVSFSAARELTRVATAETEREWLEAARGRTVRDVEKLVSGLKPGARPGDVSDPRLKRHVLRFEVSGEVLATFRDAMAKIRRDAGGALDDDAALLLLARTVLEGPRDEGRSNYQVALTVCESCRRGQQQERGELFEVPPEVVEMAECDAQHIGHVDPHVGGNGKHVHGGAHVDARLRRARQSIPPRIRRAVHRRDGGRCRVPGCRHATFCDIHHLRLWSEGGAHDMENLVVLCSAHHQALHNDELLVEGTPSTGLVFCHADGTTYGGLPLPVGVDLRAKVARALVRMGFTAAEVKQALARIPKIFDADPEQLLRQGLAALA